jgi:hypothetical protein
VNTIAQLKAEIASYLQREVSDFYVNGIDLLLTTINAAHTEAQKKRDFERAKVPVDIQVNFGRTTLMSTAILHGTGIVVDGDTVPAEEIKVKRLIRAYYEVPNSTSVVPIRLVTAGSEAYDRWLATRATYRWSPPPQQDTEFYIVNSGNYLYSYGASPVAQGNDTFKVVFDAYRFMPDYEESDASGAWVTDFLLDFGYEYLFWFSLCRLNYLNKEFVQREEGNLAPPKDEREEAWNSLVRWDASLVVDEGLDLE